MKTSSIHYQTLQITVLKKKKIYDTLCVGTRDPDSKFGPLAFDTAVYCRALP